MLPLISVPHDDTYQAPINEHGTHVAGILAADWRAKDADSPLEQDVKGMCPDINLYDLRVLGPDGSGDEFSVMAALQFVRYLNLHREIMAVHGVNLSLAISHDVLNYACDGRLFVRNASAWWGVGLSWSQRRGMRATRTCQWQPVRCRLASSRPSALLTQEMPMGSSRLGRPTATSLILLA